MKVNVNVGMDKIDQDTQASSASRLKEQSSVENKFSSKTERWNWNDG